MVDRPRYEMTERGLVEVPTVNPTVFDEQWSIKKFKKRFRIVVVRCNEDEIEFDLIGIHPGLANAFRRIMCSELPSMAIETVQIIKNTSLIPDEILAHRFGMIALKADPRLFAYKTDSDPEQKDENTTLQFEMKVKCSYVKDIKNSVCANIYKNGIVYSSQMKWVPIGNQKEKLKETDVGPIHSGTSIAEMRPGHEIDCNLFAIKSIGRDHAKFTPVLISAYRMLPDIKIIKEVSGEAAFRLQKCFSPGVIDIKVKNGKKIAVVKDARYDTASRNIYQHPDLVDSVSMTKVRDHLIFTIESAGALKPEDLFRESVKNLKDRCTYWLQSLNL